MALADFLPDINEGLVAAPMHHAALNGGKRLRAFLAMESGALFDVPRTRTRRTAAAIECMHAYSLVHDDLPCMDDDDLRRGKPTVHVKWDEATAVLTGDALQTLAFEILADVATSPDPAIRIELVQTMAKAAGGTGMVLGQAFDIAAETTETPLSLDQIMALQNLKTGNLISWPAQSGALMARESAEALNTYARALGLAFQIHDDVLDVTGDSTRTGKRLQKDAEAGKATFVSLLGLEAAKSRATLLVQEACDALSSYGSKAKHLQQVAQFVISRDV